MDTQEMLRIIRKALWVANNEGQITDDEWREALEFLAIMED